MPTAPRYIGASTWTSRIGSISKRSGTRSATTSTTVASARSGLGRSMKKKSWSWPSAGSRCGGRPPLISWAAVVIIERAAWRKIWLSRTTGAIPEEIRSSKGLPAPIGGSWSASPTKTTWVDSARPSRSTWARRRLSIEDSSTITRSAGSGWPGLKAGSRPGIHSSMRWIVCASCPVASSRRRAARPVGAQSAIFAPAASRLGDDRPGADRLADPGAAGQDRDPRREGAPHRGPLLVGESPSGASPGRWSSWGGCGRAARRVSATATSAAWVGSR